MHILRFGITYLVFFVIVLTLQLVPNVDIMFMKRSNASSGSMVEEDDDKETSLAA